MRTRTKKISFSIMHVHFYVYFSPKQRKPSLVRPLILLGFSTVLSVGTRRFKYRSPIRMRNLITASAERIFSNVSVLNTGIESFRETPSEHQSVSVIILPA